MSKFKVGDRVRRVKHTGWINNCPVGFETVVDELLGSRGFWYVGDDGQRQNSSSLGDWEIVGPVRTVSRKEIVSGKYGRLVVGAPVDGRAEISFDPFSRHYLSADELTAAIETLTAIRDVLAEAA